MEKLRPVEDIIEQAKLIRTDDSIAIDTWSIEELVADLEVLITSMEKDVQKFKAWKYKNKEAAKRIRAATKAIDTIGTRFRVLSVTI